MLATFALGGMGQLLLVNRNYLPTDVWISVLYPFFYVFEGRAAKMACAGHPRLTRYIFRSIYVCVLGPKRAVARAVGGKVE